MVEKIMITPEKVRGYGNIISPKTGADFTVSDCTLIVDTDTVNGELVTVYDLQPSTTVLSVALTVNDNSVLIGETVTLSATVEDEMSDPVSGASVSFKVGGSSIGTSTTNSSGIATYTYTCNTAGTLTFSASCMGNDSNNVNVTVTGHDYSLTFSSTSYTTNSSGDATVSAVLTDNGTAVSGATVTFTGGTSTVTATTNSSGVATATVHFTSDGTLTATSNGVSDTCNIILQTYLFYDDCSSSGISQYGSSVSVDGKSTTESLSFSTDHYILSGSGSGFAGFVIPNVNTDDVKVRIKFKLTQTSSAAYNQFGLCVCSSGTPAVNSGFRVRNDKKFQKFNITNGAESETNVYTHSSYFSSDWYYMELIHEGTSLTGTLYDKNLNQLGTYTQTITNYSNPQYIFYNLSVRGTSYATHIQEILVEAL